MPVFVVAGVHEDADSEEEEEFCCSAL